MHVVLVLLCVVYFFIPHVRADVCLMGGGVRSVVLFVCWLLCVSVLMLEACRVFSPRHVYLRAAGCSILPGRVHGYLLLALGHVMYCVWMFVVAASRFTRLGDGGSMLPNSNVFGTVSGIMREGEGLPCTIKWGVSWFVLQCALPSRLPFYVGLCVSFFIASVFCVGLCTSLLSPPVFPFV